MYIYPLNRTFFDFSGLAADDELLIGRDFMTFHALQALETMKCIENGRIHAPQGRIPVFGKKSDFSLNMSV